MRLVGSGPVNRDAIGTRVYVTANTGLTQMQEIKSGSSIGAGNDTALHFGLGEVTVEQVKIIWPDGLTRVYENVTPGLMKSFSHL